jgi:hypothetical protein
MLSPVFRTSPTLILESVFVAWQKIRPVSTKFFLFLHFFPPFCYEFAVCEKEIQNRKKVRR